MARRWVFDNDMTAGEVAPEYIMRTDAVVRNRALKTARNVILQPGGGARRRWGSRRLATLPAVSRLEVLGYGENAKLLVFYPGGFQYRNLDGAVLDTVTGCPWSADYLFRMQLAMEDGRIVVASSDFFPQVLEQTATNTWALSQFEFAVGEDGRLLQPYYRYAAAGVSIQPSGYAGSITVHFSAAILDSSWVGKRIRYDGLEIQLGALIDADDINATVTGQDLYPTVDVTLGSSDGFLVGQTVSGKDSQIEGFVAEVTDATHLKIQLHESYTAFTATEVLVGPTAHSTLSAVAVSATPAPTVVWDEQVFGFGDGRQPSVAVIHRTRLLFSGLAEVPNLFVASTIGDITNFDVGTGLDTDAIVETIGSDSTLQILHLTSAEQLLIFTQNGPYYVPEQVAAPLSPTNLEILRIGPEVADATTPLVVSEGVLFTEDNSGRMMLVAATGNVRRSWDISDLSEMAFHLMGAPTEIEVLPAGSGTDRLAFALRNDGLLAVMTYRRNAEYTGWNLWNRAAGSWRSIVGANSALYATVEAQGAFWLERFEDGIYGDSLVSIAYNGSYSTYASREVAAWYGDNKLGDFPADGSGAVPALTSDYTPVLIGDDFTVTLEAVPPVDSNYGTSRRLRICRAWFDVLNTMPFSAKGFTPGGYIAPTFGGLMTSLSGRVSATFLGHAYDDTLVVQQDQGGPFNMRSMTMEVVY